jgi:hypothetical protein
MTNGPLNFGENGVPSTWRSGHELRKWEALGQDVGEVNKSGPHIPVEEQVNPITRPNRENKSVTFLVPRGQQTA